MIQLYEADFNCYNQFCFGQCAMTTLTNSGYVAEKLFSQKGSTAEDAKFDKTLMADLSRQARQPMTVVSPNASYCYGRVNHKIMSLVWLVLLNCNVLAIVATLIYLQTMIFFSVQALAKPTPFSAVQIFPLAYGPWSPSWIQLSLVMVNVFKQLGQGATLNDPITSKMTGTMGGLFVDDRFVHMEG
jgi:hypothetical protein